MPEEKVNLPRNIDGSREVRGQILSRYDSGTLVALLMACGRRRGCDICCSAGACPWRASGLAAIETVKTLIVLLLTWQTTSCLACLSDIVPELSQ